MPQQDRQERINYLAADNKPANVVEDPKTEPLFPNDKNNKCESARFTGGHQDLNDMRYAIFQQVQPAKNSPLKNEQVRLSRNHQVHQVSINSTSKLQASAISANSFRRKIMRQKNANNYQA